ncbi:MAG: malectin domain-containing carbohydrate-binding protein, partial [Sphingorhabdus sp.]
MKLSILPERSRRVGAARSATMAGCLCLLTACVQTGVESAGEQGHAAIPETLAINVGGGAMTTLDGVAYSADESWVIGGEAGKLDAVSGTQSAELYQTYRKGAIKLSIPVPTGEYDVTLKFAEPDDTNMRARIFDVLVEGKVAIPRLNVRLRRDGNLRAGLSQTIPRVQITDGKVDIDFKAHSGEPVLSAVVIRPHAAADTSNFKLKWADEFDVDGKPDPARWNSKNWRAKRVNREDQAYTDRAKNARIKDGKLIIEAHKEDYLGAKYTSARLTSEGHGDLLYGRVEVRAKIPTGGGSWPAIWMYPTDRWRYSGGCDAKVGDPKPGK